MPEKRGCFTLDLALAVYGSSTKLLLRTALSFSTLMGKSRGRSKRYRESASVDEGRQKGPRKRTSQEAERRESVADLNESMRDGGGLTRRIYRYSTLRMRSPPKEGNEDTFVYDQLIALLRNDTDAEKWREKGGPDERRNCIAASFSRQAPSLSMIVSPRCVT